MPLNKHLRKKWEERGLRPNRASSAAVPPPPVGSHRLYHLLSAEYALSNIVFNRMKVARFSEMNDPFELSALNLRNKTTRQLIEGYKKELNDKKGLLCFSADWLDPVLWTHYGAGHTGICLGFDVPEEKARPVSYEPTKLAKRLDEKVTSIDDALSEKLVCTKFKSWSYEEEWRVMVDLADTKAEGALNFFYFHRETGVRLREIILGPLCNLPFEQVRALALMIHPKADTFKARLGSGLYGIVPDEDTVLPQPP